MSRRLVVMVGSVLVILLTSFYLMGRHYVRRNITNQPVTLYVQDLSLRATLTSVFPQQELVFEVDETRIPPITLRVEQLSSSYVTIFLEQFTGLLIYQRGNRIVVKPVTLPYQVFITIESWCVDLTNFNVWYDPHGH